MKKIEEIIKEIIEEPEQIADKAVINMKTGEILNYIYDGDKVIRKKSMEMLENNYISFNKDKTFSKMFDDAIIKLSTVLTNAQLAFIIRLVPYMDFSNLLLNPDGTIMTIVDMEKYTTTVYSVNYRMVNQLISLGVIGKWKTGDASKPKKLKEAYAVNPYIFHKGSLVNKDFLQLFIGAGWQED